jgi:tetratricopeptide (TPR) repeat protein
VPPRTTPYPTGLRISSPPPPGQISSSAPPPADLARRKSILDRAKWIDQEDAYKMLMVSREATTEEVRAAFLRAAKVWHPDSLPLSIIDVRAECERVFARITTAYETLVEPAKRARYDKEIDASQREDAEAAHLVAQAEMHVTLGERAEAEVLARKAVVASPKMAEARALLAYLESLDPKRGGKEDHLRSCVRTLDVAIGSDPSCPHAHYYRAMLQKRLEEHEGAIRDLRVAVTNDPDDAEALRELKIYETKLRDGTIQLRSLSPTGTKKPEGFFDRLRKK